MANTTAPPPHLGLGLAAAAAAASGPEMSAGSPASAWGAPAAKWVALAGVAALVAGTALYVVGTSKVRVKKGRVRNTDYAPPPPFARPGTPAYTPEEEKRYRTLLALLRSSDVAKQIQSLKTLHQMSRQAPTHDAMRQLGLLQAMLAMLKPVTAGASSSSGAGSSSGGGGGVGSSKHPLTDYESVMVELTKVVANLAANNGNRQVMGESGAIRDILRLLQDLPNEEIRENLLRTIMNLSIAAENEDRIREEGGLTLLLEFLQADDTSPALLLQTVRVLVNLSCNETNKTIMQRAGVVDRVVVLLLGSTDVDTGLAHRLVRLLGTFSVGCDLAVYEKITDRAVAQFLVTSLRKQMEKVEPDRDDKSFSEILLMAIWKITTERAPKFADALTRFQNLFIEESEADGSCGIDFIFPYLRLTHPDDRTLVLSCLNTLQHLARGNDQVQAKIRGSGALGALKELYNSREPVIAEKAVELVKSLSMIAALD